MCACVSLSINTLHRCLQFLGQVTQTAAGRPVSLSWRGCSSALVEQSTFALEVSGLCLYSQPSVVRGDVAVASGPSQADTGELTTLTRDGVVVSGLQGGAVLQGGLAYWALFPPFILLQHLVLTLGWWVLRVRYEGLLPSCSTISGVKKTPTNTWDKEMQ